MSCLPFCLCWCLQALSDSVTDGTMCVGAPEEHSWRQIICRRTCVNIEGVLSSPEMNCCGKGSVVSFPKVRNSSPALLFFSGLMTEQMLTWLSLLPQPHPSVRRSWECIYHGCLLCICRCSSVVKGGTLVPVWNCLPRLPTELSSSSLQLCSAALSCPLSHPGGSIMTGNDDDRVISD